MNQPQNNPNPRPNPTRTPPTADDTGRCNFVVNTLKHFAGAPAVCAILEREIEITLLSGDRLSNTLIVGERLSGRTLLATAFVRDAGEVPVVCDASTATIAEHILSMVQKSRGTRTLVIQNIDRLPPQAQVILAHQLLNGILPSEVLDAIIAILEAQMKAAPDATVELNSEFITRLKSTPLRIVATAENIQNLIQPLRRAFSATVQLPHVTESTMREILKREVPAIVSRLSPTNLRQISRIMIALPDSRAMLLRAIRLHACGETPAALMRDFMHRVLPSVVPMHDATNAFAMALKQLGGKSVRTKELARACGLSKRATQAIIKALSDAKAAAFDAKTIDCGTALPTELQDPQEGLQP